MIIMVKVATMTEIKANVTDMDDIRLSSSSFLGLQKILIIQYNGLDIIKTTPLKRETRAPIMTGHKMMPNPNMHKKTNMSIYFIFH